MDGRSARSHLELPKVEQAQAREGGSHHGTGKGLLISTQYSSCTGLVMVLCEVGAMGQLALQTQQEGCTSTVNS
jgi:hypothetical protein